MQISPVCLGEIKRCILHLLDFPDGSVSKESACDAGDLGLMPGEERSPRGGHDNPLQYACLENPMDTGAWRATVYRITKSQTRLINYHSHFHSLFSIINLDITISKSLRMVAER